MEESSNSNGSSKKDDRDELRRNKEEEEDYEETSHSVIDSSQIEEQNAIPQSENQSLKREHSGGDDQLQIQENQANSNPLPPRLQEIIGEWRGPFEKKLKRTDVMEYCITITKAEFDDFVKPFLNEDDEEDLEEEDGIPVTVYPVIRENELQKINSDENKKEKKKKELYMTLKVGGSESSDDNEMYVLTESEYWKDLCKENESVIKVNDFVNILMFRHCRDGNLCSIITSGRSALVSDRENMQIQELRRTYLGDEYDQSQIQENQVPPPSLQRIIGGWRGPFDKQLTNTDVNHHWLTITKLNFGKFIRPFLNNDDGVLKKGISVTVFNVDGKSFSMTLKLWGLGMYVLSGGWKGFRDEHESLIKVDEFVRIWMFRHARNQSLCFVISSGSKPLQGKGRRRRSSEK